MKRASTDPASNGAQKHARGSGDGGVERDDVDEDALVRDAENAYDDDDVGGGRGGAEEYDDDVDFDEEEVYARTGGGTGVNAVAADRENWVRKPLAKPVGVSYTHRTLPTILRG